ncbi:MAG: HAD family hydrolase [Pseudomonadota bacterium]
MTPIAVPDRIDLIIFDCDGVLIDSEVMACAVDAELLTGAGYKITAEEVARRFAGVPSDALYAAIEAELGRALPADLEDRFKARMVEKYRTELQPIAGAADTLRSLPHARCVASSSSPAKLALGLIQTDLFEMFYPHIFSTSLVARGKPHPDIFLYAARQMDAETEHCVVIEDSVAGVTAAHAAGMASIGFTGASHCGPDQSERLRQAGASHVIARMADLRTLLAQM